MSSATATPVRVRSRNLNRELTARGPFALQGERSVELAEARALWADFRAARGLARLPADLLTAPDGNYKYAKTPEATYGLSLAPARASELWNSCDYSTPECRRGCVAFAGRGEMRGVLKGRATKTQFLGAHPGAFYVILADEIARAVKRHARKGEGIGVRLNGFSDLEHERACPELFAMFPEVRFYDYTKRPFGSRDLPANYHLTYSASERSTDGELAEILRAGANVAMVVAVKRHADLPAVIELDGDAFAVVDGDASDARYLDPAGVIVGLRAKGSMRQSQTGGMVRAVENGGTK